jgi:hypothetical protein
MKVLDSSVPYQTNVEKYLAWLEEPKTCKCGLVVEVEDDDIDEKRRSYDSGLMWTCVRCGERYFTDKRDLLSGYRELHPRLPTIQNIRPKTALVKRIYHSERAKNTFLVLVGLLWVASFLFGWV